MSQDENTIVGQLFPFQKNIIKYVPNGYDVPLNKYEGEPNFKKELDDFISNSDCTFLFLGRLHSKKGLGILIEAYKSLIKKELGSIKLIIAGPDDGYLQELIQETSGLSSGTYLQFPAITGDNKDYLIRSSDVFVLPSYSEGFSIAALEAIAYAKACIFSHHIGFSDILISNNAALICDTNAESLVGQMEKLVLNANLRSNLGENALKVHSNNFTNEIVGKQFLDSVFK
jgi:glycosyltransferase involved in cell wall biosynthesis